MSHIIVIYHNNCADGFAAAWVAKRGLPSTVGRKGEFVPASYGQTPPEVIDRDVLIFDFSYPRADLLRMKAQAKSLLVFDHHASAQRELSDLDFCRFDMNRSGARLALDFFGGENWIVDYVEDRDLWRFELSSSNEINALIAAIPFNFAAWDQVLYCGPEWAKERGDWLLKARNKYITIMVPRACVGRLTKYHGQERQVPIINNTHLMSEVLDVLSQDVPFAVGWYQTAEGTFKYSLRSRPGGADVSHIASHYPNGGGHEHAAGFEVGRMVHTIEGK
jgi:hypothetical protein